MTLNFPKTLMVLLISLAFVGQALASTVMSYHMMNMKGMNAQSHDMSMMEHHSQNKSSHNMSSHDMNSEHMSMAAQQSDSDNASEDCCAKSCNCFLGGCSTVATLAKILSPNVIINLSTKIPGLNGLPYIQHSSSLYRPPIIS